MRSCAQPFILVCRHFRAGECAGMNALSRMQETSRESHLSLVPSRVQLGPLWGHYFFNKSRTTQVMFSPSLIKIMYVDGKSSSSPKRLIVLRVESCASKCYVCLITQSCLTLQPHRLYVCSLPGPSVYRILQARILEWVAIPFCGDLPYPGIKPGSPTLQADFLLSEPPEKPKMLCGRPNPWHL